MQSDKLIPDVGLEYQILNHIFEKLQSTGVLENVKDSLYHNETQELMSRIEKGEDVSLDFDLPDSFTSGFTGKTQFDAMMVNLSDLKGRRDSLNEKLKDIEDVYNFDKDYSLKSNIRTMDNLVDSAIEQILNNPRGLHPDKWQDFYSIIGGFLPGEWIGVAGGSGDGKTTWAVDLLHSLQTKYECQSAFISCEMTEEALGKKLIKRSMEISTKELVLMIHKDKDVVKKHKYKNWGKCHFMHDLYTLSDIQAFVRKYRPTFWALDYVGMVHKEKGYSSGDWSVYLSNSFKALCKETGTTGIGLYQLDKDSQKNGVDGKRKIPTLADIYGGIGNKQAMDTGAVVYRVGEDHFIYWDKVRDYYDTTHRGKHFKSNGNSNTGAIHTLEVKDDGFKIP